MSYVVGQSVAQLLASRKSAIRICAKRYVSNSGSDLLQNEKRKNHLSRKHAVLPLDTLTARTENLAARISSNRQFPPSPSSHSNRVSTDDCFDNLEAWMERAMYEGESDVHGLRKPKTLLDLMEQNLKADNGSKSYQRDTQLVPNSAFYEVVLHSFAVCSGGRKAAEECEELLHQMIANCLHFRNNPKSWRKKPIGPSTKAFNICIDAWAKSRQPDCGVHAERLLEQMNQWTEKCREFHGSDEFPLCEPNRVTFVSVLDAWTKSDDHEVAPDRSLAILTSIIDSQPNLVSPQLFNTVISTWAKSGRGRQGAEQCDQIVKLMEESSSVLGQSLLPSSFTLAAQLDGWAACERTERSGDAAGRAVRILMDAIRRFHHENGPKPNTVCFSHCISAMSWATRTSGFSRKCEDMWDKLIELYRRSNFDPELKPDTQVANIVISAYARDRRLPKSTEQAADFLKRMKDYAQPDIVSYNTILGAMGKRGMSQDALLLLARLEAPESAVQPDILSYNSVLSALAKDVNVDASQVAQMLDRMETFGETASGVVPSQVSVTITIDAWARSRNPLRAEFASQLVERMMKRFKAGDESSKPDAFVFAALLKVCSTAKDSRHVRQKAWDVALQTMKTIDSNKHCIANSFVYSAMVKVTERLCYDENVKRRILSTIFRRSVESGNLSRQVFRSVRRYGVSPDALQPRWSRNVPDDHKPSVEPRVARRS